MSKKKILIFSMAYYPRFIGGAEIAIKEITDRLSDEYVFHLITLRYDSNLPKVSTEGNVVVHRIGFSTANPSMSDLRRLPLRVLKIWYQFGAYFYARKLHQEHHYDGIWAMMAHTAGVPAGLFKRFHKDVQYTLTLQEGDPPNHIENQMRIFGSLFSAAFAGADVVQVISTFLGTWARRMGASHVEIVPNGVDVSKFDRAISPARRSELRQKMHAKEDEVLLITTSRLVPKNGIDTVIDALALMPQRIKFAIAGSGPEDARLKAQVSALSLAERVVFLNEIPQDEIPEYLASADVFVRASRSEGMGNSFIEAMAAGLPTIGTSVGGIPDFLIEGETGFVCLPDSPKGIAAAVTRVTENPQKTDQIVARAKALIRNQYDWGLVAERMRGIFNSRESMVR